jgi:hypothetical protein
MTNYLWYADTPNLIPCVISCGDVWKTTHIKSSHTHRTQLNNAACAWYCKFLDKNSTQLFFHWVSCMSDSWRR